MSNPNMFRINGWEDTRTDAEVEAMESDVFTRINDVPRGMKWHERSAAEIEALADAFASYDPDDDDYDAVDEDDERREAR